MTVRRPGQLQHGAEHHVVEAVAGLDHAAVELKIPLGDTAAPRRMVFHEAVAEMVDGVEIHRHEIPGFVLHQPRWRRRGRWCTRPGSSSPRPAAGPSPGRSPAPRGRRAARVRHPASLGLSRNSARALGQRCGWTMPGAIGQGWSGGPRAVLVVVGDHDAVDRLGRVGGPPADDVAAEALLVEDVPDRLGLARRAC